MTRQVAIRPCSWGEAFQSLIIPLGIYVDVRNRRTKMLVPRLLAFLLLIALARGCGSYRFTSVWEVPVSYHGWVLVEQGMSKCPPAKLTLTSVVHRIDASGHGCVSNHLPRGPQYLSFWDVDPQGRKNKLQLSAGNGRRIWAFTEGEEAHESVFFEATQFFVGTEAEFREGSKNRPRWWLEHSQEVPGSR